jgi:hypothetical protein
MPITINGSGTLAGLTPGGLPDGVITNPDLAADAVSRSKLDADTATGVCKAWVNFNGTGTVAIRASYNVSSITDNGTGDYTVNFAAALVDRNYSVVVGGNYSSGAGAFSDPNAAFAPYNQAPTASAVRVGTRSSSSFFDYEEVSVAIFR